MAISYEDAGNDFIIDAVGTGVRVLSKEEWKKEYEIIKVYEIEINYPAEDLHAWFCDQLNKKYALMQLFGIWFVQMKIIKHSPWGKNEELLTCNELVLMFLKRFKGLNIQNQDDFGLVRTEKEVQKCQSLQ